MRWRGLAPSHGTVPPISQRGLCRSTTYQGQERSQCSGRPDHRVARGSPRRGSGSTPCQPARGFPQTGWRRVLPQPVAQSFLSPIDRGFPQAKGLKFSLRRVAQSFLLITQLGVSPPPHNLKFPFADGPELSSPRATRGFPSAAYLEVFPAPLARGFPLAGFPSCRVAPGFPRDQRPQSLPNTGWPGVSPAPLARSFLLAGGAGLLLARKPGVVLCRVARGFPFTGYRPWW
jgi:hypothetical protein